MRFVVAAFAIASAQVSAAAVPAIASPDTRPHYAAWSLSGVTLVRCQPGIATDISFEPDEIVNDAAIGDSSRWVAADAKSEHVDADGSRHIIRHIIVKPTDPGLTTNLTVTTNRHTYHLLLESEAQGGWLYMTFTSPRTFVSRASGAFGSASADASGTRGDLAVSPATGAGAARNCHYTVSSPDPFGVLGVCNDGWHTYVELRAMPQYGTPTLLVRGFDGNESVVNGRFDPVTLTFKIDSVPDALYLDYGNGRARKRTVITKG